jgi:hypothetical protein
MIEDEEAYTTGMKQSRMLAPIEAHEDAVGILVIAPCPSIRLSFIPDNLKRRRKK